ncbi:MAG: ribonuclease J, partial [Acidimicrobiia bacterium]|nr:ribonuclease J [Acidimicrobiia bacterium]
VEAGYVYLDGLGVGDVREGILRDRSHLGDDGVVVVSVGLNAKTGDIIYGPDLTSHGFMDDPDQVLAKAVEAIEAALAELAPDSGEDDDSVAVVMRRAVARVIRSETKRRPVILPVVQEL